MDKQIELILSYQEVDKELKMLEDELLKNEDTQKFFTANYFFIISFFIIPLILSLYFLIVYTRHT